MPMISKISGGVTAAKGFSAACCAAGIKYRDRTDMAMLYSSVPCTVAGVFTSNKVKAAPVLWDRGIVASGHPVQAVVVNAGIANAATGGPGLKLCISLKLNFVIPLFAISSPYATFIASNSPLSSSKLSITKAYSGIVSSK